MATLSNIGPQPRDAVLSLHSSAGGMEIGATVLEVDTADFGAIDYEAIFQAVKESNADPVAGNLRVPEGE